MTLQCREHRKSVIPPPGGGGDSHIKRMGDARRTFEELKSGFGPFLIGCSASKAPQRELLRHLLGH